MPAPCPLLPHQQTFGRTSQLVEMYGSKSTSTSSQIIDTSTNAIPVNVPCSVLPARRFYARQTVKTGQIVHESRPKQETQEDRAADRDASATLPHRSHEVRRS